MCSKYIYTRSSVPNLNHRMYKQIFYSFIARILASRIFQVLTVTEIHANNFLKRAQLEIHLAWQI